MHEALVDLELVEGEAAQIEQAGIAGSEIVERKLHAERLEAEHRELGGVYVAEQGAFGDFELKTVRVEAGLRQDALHDVDEISAAELQRGDVDRDRDPRPRLAVETGAAQHPFAEVDDQARVLGDGDELSGRNLAADRVRPAAERFHRDDRLAAVVDDGLVGDPQLVLLDRGAQVVLDELALEQIGIHRGVVDASPVAALVLGAIERHVGVAHDVGRTADVLVDQGDADAGADHDAVVADAVGRAKRCDHPVGEPLQRHMIAAEVGDDGELVASDAGNEVFAAQRMLQALGHSANDLVADRVA